jgi:hypothetical protein
MSSFRITKKVTARRLSIELPDNFGADEVEVVVSPVTPTKAGSKQALGDLLLSGPCISKEEADNLKKTRKWFDGWKVRQFS